MTIVEIEAEFILACEALQVSIEELCAMIARLPPVKETP